jgi:hypothetical protein
MFRNVEDLTSFGSNLHDMAIGLVFSYKTTWRIFVERKVAG